MNTCIENMVTHEKSLVCLLFAVTCSDCSSHIFFVLKLSKITNHALFSICFVLFYEKLAQLKCCMTTLDGVRSTSLLVCNHQTLFMTDRHRDRECAWKTMQSLV